MRRLPLLLRPRRIATPAALALAVLWSACTDAPSSPAGPDVLTTQASISVLQELDIGQALAAQERHGDRLMAISGVVGHGVGVGTNGEPAVVVFTLGPGTSGIPDRVENVQTRTIASGRFVALTDETARYRPAPLGVSIGHPDITAGTLGFKVNDGAGNSYILSNNHVLANANNASIGDNILQPGPYDGGSDPADKIGTLAGFVEIDFDGGNNVMDAAIARIVSGDVLSHTGNEGYTQPSSNTTSAAPGMRVTKYGRTTGATFGIVDATNATVDVCYQSQGPIRCKKLARFVDQIIITPGSFSAGGDSGSGIVTEFGDNDPVGLLFAGSSTHTIANPIDEVLSTFGVTVDDGSGGGTPVNSPPTANDVTASGDEGDASIAWTPDVSDPNGADVLTCSIASQPTNGSADVAPNCSSGTYDPDPDFSGQDPFTYSVSDGNESDQGTVTVTVNPAGEPPAGVTVGSVTPGSASTNSSVGVTIAGSGFEAGASVTLENGSGPAPQVSNVVVVDATTITATFTVNGGGPPRNRVWDVRVSNPGGSSGVLADGFTVTP